MPSDSMNIQEQGFRSRMFGGFDKNDVLAYMNTLANEAQQHELEYQEKPVSYTHLFSHECQVSSLNR